MKFVRKVSVAPEWLLDWMQRPEAYKTSKNCGEIIPVGAEIVEAFHQGPGIGYFVLLLSHDSFGELLEGEEIPSLVPTYERTHPE